MSEVPLYTEPTHICGRRRATQGLLHPRGCSRTLRQAIPQGHSRLESNKEEGHSLVLRTSQPILFQNPTKRPSMTRGAESARTLSSQRVMEEGTPQRILLGICSSARTNATSERNVFTLLPSEEGTP